MRILVILACATLAACAQYEGGGMPMPPLSRPVFGAGPPQPQIIGTPRGGIICQRTGPNSAYCS